MSTNTDIYNQLKKDVDTADGLSAKNILNLLEMKGNSVWFSNELLPDSNKETDFTDPEEALLTFEQVKQLYPDWFKI